MIWDTLDYLFFLEFWFFLIICVVIILNKFKLFSINIVFKELIKLADYKIQISAVMIVLILVIYITRVYSYIRNQPTESISYDTKYEKSMSISVSSLSRNDNESDMCDNRLEDNYESALIDFTGFQKDKCIGFGSFGKVFLCSIANSERRYAVKILEEEVKVFSFFGF